MKRLNWLMSLALIVVAIGCSSIPKKELIVLQKSKIAGRDILTVVMSDLKKKEFAALSAGIVSAAGSPKIVPIPDGVDRYVEEAIEEAMANRSAPVVKEIVDILSMTLSFDTILIVKTYATDVTDRFIGIEIKTYPDSMHLLATLFDVKSGGLLGAIASPVRVLDQSSRIADIGEGARGAIAELMEEVSLDEPKKEEKGGDDPKKLLRACKKGDGAACGKIGDLFMEKTDIRDHRRKAEDFYRKGCDLDDKTSCDKYDKLIAGDDGGDDEEDEDRPAKRSKRRSYDEDEEEEEEEDL
ncbi:MAG TPA: hypothetical protein PKH10_12990 [bacterium]|nr:hypothetical protein [bacterium]